MASIDRDYKNSNNALLAHLGAILATAGLFAVIATTSANLGKRTVEVDDKQSVFFLAPPKVETELVSTVPKETVTIETFSVDISDATEPSEIQLKQLDISLRADISASSDIEFDIKRDFKAKAPELGDLDNFQIHDRSEVDERPSILYASPPTVKSSLRGKPARVIVFYYVNEKGKTENVSVLDSSSDNPLFAESAKEAVSRWRFRPAKKDGQVVACWIQQTINFQKGNTSPFSL